MLNIGFEGLVYRFIDFNRLIHFQCTGIVTFEFLIQAFDHKYMHNFMFFLRIFIIDPGSRVDRTSNLCFGELVSDLSSNFLQLLILFNRFVCLD